uniref:Uncharacterized protein n=1 Tax=Amphimedon queenslandica TaxID=400682 RepID=A0A1X7SEU9_AMPQE
MELLARSELDSGQQPVADTNDYQEVRLNEFLNTNDIKSSLQLPKNRPIPLYDDVNPDHVTVDE